MAIGGMTLEDLPAAARIPRNLDVKKIALLVKGVGNFGKHAAAKIAGFQKDSVIVAIDGNETRRTEGELLGWLRERHRAGEKAKVIVLRGTAPVELSLPMQ